MSPCPRRLKRQTNQLVDERCRQRKAARRSERDSGGSFIVMEGERVVKNMVSGPFFEEK